MAIGNAISVVGNLTVDPILRFTPGGMAVAQMGVAVNRRRQDKKTNAWIDETSFVDVTCYGTLAENVAESLSKGARVLVEGRLNQNTWEDKQTGDKRSKLEVVADEIGPSLRWANATVTKNEKRENTSNGGGGEQRPAARSRGSESTSSGSGNRPAPAPAYDYDEEPFVMDTFDGEDRFGPGTSKYPR